MPKREVRVRHYFEHNTIALEIVIARSNRA